MIIPDFVNLISPVSMNNEKVGGLMKDIGGPIKLIGPWEISI